MKNNVEERFNIILRDILQTNEPLFPETKIMDDLGADSIDMYEISMAAEEEFSINIPDDALEKFVTIEDACYFIHEEMKGERLTAMLKGY